MFAIAAYALLASQQPDFALALQPAPILLVRVPMDNRDELFGLDTGSMDLLLKPDPRQAGPTTTINLPFLSTDPLPARRVYFPTPAEGIIGLNALRQKAVGIDVHNATLSIWNAGNLTADQINFYFSHTPDAQQSAWNASDAIQYQTIDLIASPDGHFLVDGKVGDNAVKFGLDTDSAFCSVASTLATPTNFIPLHQQSVGGINQDWAIKLGIIQDITFADQHLQAMPVVQVPPGNINPAQGLLGFNVFQNRRALIDFPAHKLYLGAFSPTPTGEESLLPFGIRLAPFMGGKQYIGVLPDSAAAKAGLQSGDQLVAIDKKPIGQSNVPNTGSVLPFDYARTPLPTTLTVSISRPSSQPITFTLTRTAGS